MRKVQYVVPQGSILGPRMFSIHIDNISESNLERESHLCADNIIAFIIGKTTDNAVSRMQCLVNKIMQWCVRKECK